MVKVVEHYLWERSYTYTQPVRFARYWCRHLPSYWHSCLFSRWRVRTQARARIWRDEVYCLRCSRLLKVAIYIKICNNVHHIYFPLSSSLPSSSFREFNHQHHSKCLSVLVPRAQVPAVQPRSCHPPRTRDLWSFNLILPAQQGATVTVSPDRWVISSCWATTSARSSPARQTASSVPPW